MSSKRFTQLLDITKKVLLFLGRVRSDLLQRGLKATRFRQELILGNRIPQNLTQLPDVFRIGDLVLVCPLQRSIKDRDCGPRWSAEPAHKSPDTPP
jgi:hypothetical protein